MEIIKGFKSEIFVNDNLKKVFNQFFGNRRFIYNQLLSILKKYKKSPIKTFIDNDKVYSIKSKDGLQKIFKYLSEDYDFLSNSHSQANQSARHNLHLRWSNFLDFTKPNFEEPKFKKRKLNIETFYIPNQNNIELNKMNDGKHYIYIKPLDKFIKNNINDKKLLNSYNKIFIKDYLPEEILNNDIQITGIRIKSKKNKLFLSFTYKYENNINKITEEQFKDYIKNNSSRIIGIDIGLKDKMVFSTGEKFKSIIEKERYKEKEKFQKALQKQLSKIVNKRKTDILNKRIKNGYKSIIKKEYSKIKRSRKRNKYKEKIKLDKLKFKVLKEDYVFSKKDWKKIYGDINVKRLSKEVNKLENKLTNIRENENHQISKKIVENNDIILMETLTYKGMQKLWGNKIKKLGLSSLTNMIGYKPENQGKIFFKIDRFYPSTKTCSCCGNIQTIKLNERIYKCKNCKTEIDRDINRGINIKNFGIKSYMELNNINI